MSLKDKTAEAAQAWMQATDPQCPACGSKGLWNYSAPTILNKHDSKTGASFVSQIVLIKCGKCGHEMPHYEEK